MSLVVWLKVEKELSISFPFKNTREYTLQSPVTPGVTGEHRRCAPAMSASRTGNSDWLQQISWPLIGPPVIPGATGAGVTGGRRQ